MSTTMSETLIKRLKKVESKAGVRLWRRLNIAVTESVAVMVSARSTIHAIWATVCVMVEAKAEAVVTDSVRTIHHRAEVSTLTPTVSAEVLRAQDLIRVCDNLYRGGALLLPIFN